MPNARASNGVTTRVFFFTGVLLSALTLVSCKPKAAPRSEERGQVVNAAWYAVPADSLARRRAGADELTAAHDKLPIGTLLRVTRIDNGKSVVVRITDRGIRDHDVELDLCKQAAEQLEMVSKGIAQVRMEVISEGEGSARSTPAP